MPKKLWIVAAIACIASLVGCEGGSAPEESKDLRESMNGKSNFDINKVPEKDRAIVEAMRGGGGRPGSAPPGTQPGGGTGSDRPPR